MPIREMDVSIKTPIPVGKVIKMMYFFVIKTIEINTMSVSEAVLRQLFCTCMISISTLNYIHTSIMYFISEK